MSVVGAYALRYGPAELASLHQPIQVEYLLVAVVAAAVWSLLYLLIKLDGFSGGWNLPSILSQVLIGVMLLMSILLAGAFLGRRFYSRLVMFYFGALLVVGFVAIRSLMRSYVLSRSRSGGLRRVVILGNGRVARELANKIERHPEFMKRVVGFLYPSTDVPTGSWQQDVPASATFPTNTLGAIELLKEQGIDEIIVVHPKASLSEIRKFIHSSQVAGLTVSLVPQGYELYISRPRFLDVEGLPVLSLEETAPNPLLLATKRASDFVFAIALTVFAAPIFVVGALALITRNQKPLRRELRCGLNGRQFSMWRMNIDRESSELVGLRRWLARLSLTELPQLWNVILGDMTLVGPRPEPPERVKHYSDWQRQRLNVKPGLTGLAQVHGLREQHSSEEKARFDLQYILHWSPFFDLSLLLQTIWTVAVRLASSEPRAVLSMPFREKEVEILTSEVMSADRTHAGAD
jgi:lipopolysaccharide/colanic/teichoic acid biosynthesis glycosyltransferase